MEMQTAEKCESLARFRVSAAQTKIWVIVTLRDDTCYSFRFPEWGKGQDVMDEVSQTKGACYYYGDIYGYIILLPC